MTTHELARKLLSEPDKTIAPKRLSSVHVVGIPQTGGCWISTGKCFANYFRAKDALEDDRKQGIDYTKIFDLEINERDIWVTDDGVAAIERR